jgi:hypothetical protein
LISFCFTGLPQERIKKIKATPAEKTGLFMVMIANDK